MASQLQTSVSVGSTSSHQAPAAGLGVQKIKLRLAYGGTFVQVRAASCPEWRAGARRRFRRSSE
jgi:hypothetical protein